MPLALSSEYLFTTLHHTGEKQLISSKQLKSSSGCSHMGLGVLFFGNAHLLLSQRYEHGKKSQVHNF